MATMAALTRLAARCGCGSAYTQAVAGRGWRNAVAVGEQEEEEDEQEEDEGGLEQEEEKEEQEEEEESE
ncbi:hypothetical protein RB195_003541 [Necator americanus]